MSSGFGVAGQRSSSFSPARLGGGKRRVQCQYQIPARCKPIRGASAEPQVSLPAHKALALEVPVLVGRSFRGHVPKLAQALCLTIAPEPDAICALLCCFVAERKEPGCPLKRAKGGTALG